MNVIHNEVKKSFGLYDDNGGHVGELEYMKGGSNELFATHTEVFPGNEGKGYGALLLDALVAYAEGRGSKIVPVCSYVKSMFGKYPEKYAAVIKP